MSVRHFIPSGIESQLISLQVASFMVLLCVLTVFEFLDEDTAGEWAVSGYSTNRLHRMLQVMPYLEGAELDEFLVAISRCHEGYSVTPEPYPAQGRHEEAAAIEVRLAEILSVRPSMVKASFVTFARTDFSYGECAPGEMTFPVDGIIVSISTNDDRWLNAEIHPHEWHLTPTITGWLVRSAAAFIIVGAVAVIFVRRIGRPLNALTNAARAFGHELQVARVDEDGPDDVRRAIKSFNNMQLQVAEEVKRRAATLAAISHDIRSPMTALRLKAELVLNDVVRADLLNSVAKMEHITRSALEYLMGESRSEELRRVDICSLVESECEEFADAGHDIRFRCEYDVNAECRPEALSRAVRNLIENALKYAGDANVSVTMESGYVKIIVADTGPGIPPAQRSLALNPFERLSGARNSGTGGFGVGLAIVKAVADGHDGLLTLEDNQPSGLVAIISFLARR